ncbi:MAG: hypothetical protein QM579_00010 [Desulfovibrio sp.]|uniref:hypothetical protein n=1 Tax=Desulfovibrio sp. TaxID=885 RepID=UPI0039E25063
MHLKSDVWEWQALHGPTYNAQDIVGNTVRRSFAARLLNHSDMPPPGALVIARTI